MSLTLHLLIEAEAKATQLFEEIEKRGLITPGISEKEVLMKMKFNSNSL